MSRFTFQGYYNTKCLLAIFLQLEGDQRFIPTFGKIKRHCSNSYTSVDFLDLTRINWLKNLWTQTVNSYFLFSSPELKAKWDFFYHLLTGVSLSLCLSVCKLLTQVCTNHYLRGYGEATMGSRLFFTYSNKHLKLTKFYFRFI